MRVLKIESKPVDDKHICPETKILVDGKPIHAVTKLSFEISTENYLGTYKLEGVFPSADLESDVFDYVLGNTTLKFNGNTITIITDKEVTIEKPII